MLGLSRADRLARLARRGAAGDRGALRGLYRGLHGDVHGFVHRRISNRADADDIVADVFVRVVDHLGRYDPARAGVRTWVLSIARNAVIDHVRARRSTVAVHEVEIVEPGVDLVDRLARDAQLRTVAERVDALEPAARELLALRYGDGLAHREIAGLLGLSEDAVKQRCSRLLRELRSEFAAREPKGKAAHVV